MKTVPFGPVTIVRPPGWPCDQTSALKPVGSFSLSTGILSSAVAIGGSGCGASGELAMLAGMPCFQIGGGAGCLRDRRPCGNQQSEKRGAPSCRVGSDRSLFMRFLPLRKSVAGSEWPPAPMAASSRQCSIRAVRAQWGITPADRYASHLPVGVVRLLADGGERRDHIVRGRQMAHRIGRARHRR